MDIMSHLECLNGTTGGRVLAHRHSHLMYGPTPLQAREVLDFIAISSGDPTVVTGIRAQRCPRLVPQLVCMPILRPFGECMLKHV